MMRNFRWQKFSSAKILVFVVDLAQTKKILLEKILPTNFEPCSMAIIDVLVASLTATI